MKIRTSNKLNMVGACLTVAHDAKYQPVWSGQSPVSFERGLATLQAGYLSLTLKASEAEAANGGAADTKAKAASTLVENAHVLARALAVHFRSTGDLTRLGQVDLTRTDFIRLRGNELVPGAIVIRDIGAVAQSEPTASDSGVTAERVSALAGAIEAFQAMLTTPRGKIVDRKTLLNEIEVDVVGLLVLLRDLDDLVLQFNETDRGRSFIAAWRNARIVIDRAGAFAKPETSPSPVIPAAS